jgi:hypothetical protein
MVQLQPWQHKPANTRKTYGNGKNMKMTNALSKQLISIIEPAYLTNLEDEFSGFNKVEVKNLLNYLFQTYSHISSMNLIENNCKFESDWDPTEPWQTVMT